MTSRRYRAREINKVEFVFATGSPRILSNFRFLVVSFLAYFGRKDVSRSRNNVLMSLLFNILTSLVTYAMSGDLSDSLSNSLTTWCSYDIISYTACGSNRSNYDVFD